MHRPEAEIRADIARYEEGDSTLKYGPLIRELRRAIIADISLDRLSEICNAEKEERLEIKPKPAHEVDDTVRIIDAMDRSWIGKIGRVISVSNYFNCPTSYRLDIGGGDWLQSMIVAQATLQEGAADER